MSSLGSPCFVSNVRIWLHTHAKRKVSVSSFPLWGYGSQHDGERYRVCLCEPCFFLALAHLRQVRRVHRLFDDEQPDDEDFGQVARDDFWGES